IELRVDRVRRLGDRNPVRKAQVFAGRGDSYQVGIADAGPQNELILTDRLLVVVATEVGDVIDGRSGVLRVWCELRKVPITARNTRTRHRNERCRTKNKHIPESTFHGCITRVSNPTGKWASASANLTVIRPPVRAVGTAFPSNTLFNCTGST